MLEFLKGLWMQLNFFSNHCLSLQRIGNNHFWLNRLHFIQIIKGCPLDIVYPLISSDYYLAFCLKIYMILLWISYCVYLSRYLIVCIYGLSTYYKNSLERSCWSHCKKCTNYILCPWIAKSLWREIILINCPFCCEAMWLESIIAGVSASPLFTNFTRQDKNLHSKQRSKRTRARHERAIIFWFICSADLWESNHNHWNILVWTNSWYIYYILNILYTILYSVKMVNRNQFLRNL